MGGQARRYGARMIELVGDSSRDGEWALVRLRVDGDTIVEADAPGLSRDLEGLTLLEAAAVPRRDARRRRARERDRAGRPRGRGSPSRRRGDERRGRQRRRAAARRAVSRRRDAQALARPGRPECRACMLLARRGHRGPRGLPRAWTPSRHARPPGGVPARDRRALRARLRARRDAEPLHRVQRELPVRGAARVRGARRRSAARDRALRANRLATAAGCSSRAQSTARRISRTCSAGSIPRFSTGSGSRSASRRRP